MRSRAGAMGESLGRVAFGAGIPPDGVELLGRAYRLAMLPRESLGDDHHPAYLHPARSALVLLRDTDERSPEVIAAAIVLESIDASLAVDPSGVEAALGAGAAEVAAPGSSGEPGRRAEELVGAERGSRRAALAERLDQFRHLHMRPDLETRWGELHAQAEAFWGPLAERTDRGLARRYARWIEAFGRRLD